MRSRYSRPVATVAALGVLLAACGDGDDDSSSAASDDTGSAVNETDDTADSDDAASGADDTEAPQEEGDADGASGEQATPASDAPATDPEGVLKFLWYPTTTLDPHTNPNSPFTFGSPTYDRLLKMGDDGSVQPNLVSEWQFVDDNGALELTLRDDVTFHDGTPLDADAVRASLERAMSIEGSTVQSLLTSVDSVDAVDATTVRINLVAGTGAELPAHLASAAGVVLNPAVIDDPSVDLATAPPPEAGSGPYVVEQFVPNETITFVRADGDYWDDSALLNGAIEMMPITDPTARMNALTTGEADLALMSAGSTASTAQEMIDSGDFTGFVATSRSAYDLMLKVDHPSVSDVEVRRAIAMAIDKEAIADSLLEGWCLPTNQPIGEGYPAHNPAIEELYTYDPEAAAQLIADSGARPQVEIMVAAPSSLVPIAEAAQAQLSEIGVEATVSPMAFPDALTKWIPGEAAAWQHALYGWYDPAFTVGQFYLGGIFGLVPEADRAQYGDQALAALDPSLSEDERGAMYQELFADLADGYYDVPICHYQQVWLGSNRLVDFTSNPMSPFGEVDLRYVGVAAG